MSPQPPASRPAWRYLAAVGLTFMALVAAIAAALITLAGRGPTEHTSASARWVYFFDQQKRRIAAAAPGPQVQLIGGSSAFYSIRAQRLQTLLGVAVVNNALHVGLGLDYLLERAREILRPGDLAVLVLEYDLLFDRGEVNWTLADYALPFDLPYLARQPPGRWIEAIGRLTPQEYGLRLHDSLLSPAVGPDEMLQTLNARADLVANRLSAQNDAHRAQLRATEPYVFERWALELLSNRLARLAEFLRWCRDRQVRVVLGFAPFMDFARYHAPAQRWMFDEIAARYRALGVPVLGSPFEFMLAADRFFDTRYHLHDEAAAAFSARIAALLAPFVRDHPALVRPPEWAPLQATFDLDLSRPDDARHVSRSSGFSSPEPWGRWTDGAQAHIELAGPLPRQFRLELRVAHLFAANAGSVLRIRIGAREHAVVLERPGQTVSVDIETDGTADTITLLPARPASPRSLGQSDDARLLGVGLTSIGVRPAGA